MSNYRKNIHSRELVSVGSGKKLGYTVEYGGNDIDEFMMTIIWLKQSLMNIVLKNYLLQLQIDFGMVQ